METENSIYEFIGINSSDYEKFCWDVDLKTFTRITQRIPLKTDESCFKKGLYKIYPEDLYGTNNCKCKIEIKIDVL